MDMNYRSNITFLETRKIVESYMKDNSYANVPQSANPINQIRITLIEILVQLELNDWPNFQEEIKPTFIWNQTKGIHNEHPYHCPPTKIYTIRVGGIRSPIHRPIPKIRGLLNKFPDFFHTGTFIDSTHMKL